jgi:hypothetical protein
MSALHRIETSSGAAYAEAAPLALSSVRQALSLLQSWPRPDATVEAGLEAIASSLGIVHELSQAAPTQARPYAPAGPAPLDARAGAPARAPAQAVLPAPPRVQQAEPQRDFSPLQSHPHLRQSTQAPVTQPSAPHETRRERQPHVALVNPVASNATQAQAGAPIFFEAALGAHSASNFYKGLSGNDVVDAGGVFIATYQIPAVGAPVMIRVSLPGGYEFDAMGIVCWTRETADSEADSPPGFGARFTQISQEGRQLVYRYVKNREPLFHDDL